MSRELPELPLYKALGAAAGYLGGYARQLRAEAGLLERDRLEGHIRSLALAAEVERVAATLMLIVPAWPAGKGGK